MKIIEAYWEKRNLGLLSKEIVVELGDTVAEVGKVLKEVYGEYIVVSLPSGRKDLYDLMTAYSYSFVESTIHLEMNICAYHLKEDQKEIASHLTYTLNDINVRERIEQEIRKGMYNTDRISIDNRFSQKDTTNHYLGFLNDELSRGATIMEFKYNGLPIGYSCLRRTSDMKWHQSLVGMYEIYRGKGLGFSFSYLQAKELAQRQVSILSTVVSSNNIASLHVHTKNGFVPINIRYVFVKHLREEDRINGAKDFNCDSLLSIC